MTLLTSFRKGFMQFKLIAVRLSGYLSLINLGMIMFLTIQSLNDKGYIHINLGTYLVPIYLGAIALLFVLGYFEMYIFKGYNEEVEAGYRLMQIHPDLRDMKAKIDKMYGDIYGDKQ